jgi:hypothetical protein
LPWAVCLFPFAPNDIALSIDYVSEGFDAKSLSNRDEVDATTRFAVGKALIARLR